MSIRTFYANAYETVLTEEMGPTDTAAEVATTSGAPGSPAYLVIDPDEPARREYILFDDSFEGSVLRTSSVTNRYLEGSAETSNITHPVGAVVRMSPVQQHFDDLHTRIEGRMSSSAHTKNLHDNLEISHTSLSDRAESNAHPISAIPGLQGLLDNAASHAANTDDPHGSAAAVFAGIGSMMASRADEEENVWSEAELRRPDGTLYLRSVLSGGSAPTYTTRTVTVFEPDGVTEVGVWEFEQQYDNDDRWVGETPV